MRGNLWLAKQLNFLLRKYFDDLKITNPIEIRFGREARYRFGSIRLYPSKRLGRLGRLGRLRGLPQKSVITITSMFAKDEIPVKVVQYTIAHELCHWAHGFSSANRRLFKYPHHGGVVNRELRERGVNDLILEFRKWLKSYRQRILKGKISV